ncbi:MAG: class I SAM-dependent methyltransferase [Vicinamibacteria bacterium]
MTSPRLLIRSVALALRPRGKKSRSTLARLATAVAAGTFTEEELAEARIRHWANFADGHGSHKAGLFPWETRFYGRHLKPKSRLLIVGAGSGRDVLCFLRDGHRATAIDESAEALLSLERRLNRAELSADVRSGSIVSFETQDRFDAVIFSWLSYILIPARADRLTALEHAARTLAPDGRILVSYKPGSTAPWMGRITRGLAKVLGAASPEDFEEFELQGPAAAPMVYHTRFFTSTEIEGEARAAGLVVQDHHPGAPGWDDPGCIVLGLPSSGDPAPVL